LEIVNEISDFSASLAKLEFGAMSNSDISESVLDFARAYTKSLVQAWTRPDGFLENELKTAIGEANFIKIATLPEMGELAYSQEPLDLLYIAKKIKDGMASFDNLPEEIISSIDDHVEKYSWLKGPVASEEINFTKLDYILRLKNLVDTDIDTQIENILGTRGNNQKVYKETIKKLQPDAKLLKLTEAMRTFTFLRTFAIEASDRLFYSAKNTILKEAATRLNIPVANLIMLEAQEIAKALEIGKANHKTIMERKDGFAILWLDGVITTRFGLNVAGMQNEVAALFQNTEMSQSDIIRGFPGSSGVARESPGLC